MQAATSDYQVEVYYKLVYLQNNYYLCNKRESLWRFRLWDYTITSKDFNREQGLKTMHSGIWAVSPASTAGVFFFFCGSFFYENSIECLNPKEFSEWFLYWLRAISVKYENTLGKLGYENCGNNSFVICTVQGYEHITAKKLGRIPEDIKKC